MELSRKNTEEREGREKGGLLNQRYCPLVDANGTKVPSDHSCKFGAESLIQWNFSL